MAAAPPMREMQERVAGWFADGVAEDEIRRRLCEQAVDSDFGLRAFLGFNRKAMRMKAADALVYVAHFYAKKLGSKTMKRVLGDWAASIGVDSWLADYQITWYKTGYPPPLGEHMFGGVSLVTMGPKDDPVPMVFAIAGAMSDPEALAEDFVNRCYREFPQAFARKDHAERDAERALRFGSGESDFEIARDELEAEGWSLAAANKREYNRGVQSRANSIAQARKRWSEYVTTFLDPVSPSSD